METAAKRTCQERKKFCAAAQEDPGQMFSFIQRAASENGQTFLFSCQPAWSLTCHSFFYSEIILLSTAADVLSNLN